MAKPKAHFFTPETDVAPKAFTVLSRGRKWLHVQLPGDAPGVENRVMMGTRTTDWAAGDSRVETLVTVVTQQNRYGVVWHFEAVAPEHAPLIALQRLLNDVQTRRAGHRGLRVNDGSYRLHDVTCQRLADAHTQGWFDVPGAQGLRTPILARLMKHVTQTQNSGGRNFDASCRLFRHLGGLNTPHASTFLTLEAIGQAAFVARTARDRIAIPLSRLVDHPLGRAFLLDQPYVTEAQVVVPVRVGEVFHWPAFRTAQAKVFAEHPAWFEHVRNHLLGVDGVSLYLRPASDEERAAWEGPYLKAKMAEEAAQEAGNGLEHEIEHDGQAQQNQPLERRIRRRL